MRVGAGVPTRRVDLVETLHGQAVADPYRWLEDADDPEVVAWAGAQQARTDAALASLPERAWFADTMARIVARPRAGAPLVRGGRFFVSRNDGTSAQDVWYTADSLAELESGGRVVLDPAGWSADGTASLSAFTVSDDGALMAYARSEAGSDWQHIHVKDLATGADLDDPVVAKFTSPEWLPDHRSFLYTTYAEADDARGTATADLGVAELRVHRLDGTDEHLLSFPHEPRTRASGQVSHDGAWLVVRIVRGTEKTNRLWVLPLTTDAGRTTIGEPLRVVDAADAAFAFVCVDGSALYLRTDRDAPRGRVVRLDLQRAARGDVELIEVVPEAPATLIDVQPTPAGLLLAYLNDASALVMHTRLDGSGARVLPLPAGALTALDASVTSPDAFVGISTLDVATMAFHVAVSDADAPDVRRLALAPQADSPAGPWLVQRARATSADGTQVPHFLAVPDDGRTGPRPTLLYGYGGFGIPVQADHRPGWAAWLRAGGALALANLRGGGEFGQQWYDDGRLGRKQHVFDDVIGVAEHLVATGVTTPGQLALYGRSNGGLLVGAAMTQRPDLFAVALPTVGVLDLLRFHRFTIGSAWMSDYGDPDTPDGFATALAYSPLHNLRPGTRYPATLVATADHDDRVVPLHSFKFAAALQAAQADEAPVLLRVESSAGHGAGKPLPMVAAEWTDLLAFAAHHTGLRPPADG